VPPWCSRPSAPACMRRHWPWRGRWLGQGIHVVTPNKRLGSGPACEYQAAMQAARSGGGMFFSEARHPGAPLCGCMHGSRAQFIGGAGRRTARA